MTSVLESSSFLHNQYNWSHKILRWWPWSMIMRANTTPSQRCLLCSGLVLILASRWSQSLCDKNHCFVYWCIMVHCSRLFFLIFWFKVNIILQNANKLCIFTAEFFPNILIEQLIRGVKFSHLILLYVSDPVLSGQE